MEHTLRASILRCEQHTRIPDNSQADHRWKNSLPWREPVQAGEHCDQHCWRTGKPTGGNVSDSNHGGEGVHQCNPTQHITHGWANCYRTTHGWTTPHREAIHVHGRDGEQDHRREQPNQRQGWDRNEGTGTNPSQEDTNSTKKGETQTRVLEGLRYVHLDGTNSQSSQYLINYEQFQLHKPALSC